MMHCLTWPRTLAAAALIAALAVAAPARADQWNDRTELTFSSPVMVPGATLQPGTYVFTLADSDSSRHLVRIYKKGDERTLVALTQAIPIKRDEARGDTILTFNPTEQGMPALKAWYYPGSVYGHEFVYSEAQARQIAERSKTIVLSVDVPDTDLSKGTLRVYHPTGERTEWQADANTAREWEAWQRDRAMVRTADRGAGDQRAEAEDGEETAEARAPMMAAAAAATRVDINELEENPAKYLGQTITVDAEVEEVYGPRLFTIDEPHWIDLSGEILVFAPSFLAALVKDDDRISVTGTLKQVAMAEIEREFGWMELDPEIEIEFIKKPVLIADRIVGGDDNVAMYIDMSGTTGGATGAASPVMDLGRVANGTEDMVGRTVDLKNVRVLRPSKKGGFYVDAQGKSVLVLPAHNVTVNVAPGDQVSLQGAIADAPRDLDQQLTPPAGWNDQIYVVATTVSK